MSQSGRASACACAGRRGAWVRGAQGVKAHRTCRPARPAWSVPAGTGTGTRPRARLRGGTSAGPVRGVVWPALPLTTQRAFLRGVMLPLPAPVGSPGPPAEGLSQACTLASPSASEWPQGRPRAGTRATACRLCPALSSRRTGWLSAHLASPGGGHTAPRRRHWCWHPRALQGPAEEFLGSQQAQGSASEPLGWALAGSARPAPRLSVGGVCFGVSPGWVPSNPPALQTFRFNPTGQRSPPRPAVAIPLSLPLARPERGHPLPPQVLPSGLRPPAQTACTRGASEGPLPEPRGPRGESHRPAQPAARSGHHEHASGGEAEDAGPARRATTTPWRSRASG